MFSIEFYSCRSNQRDDYGREGYTQEEYGAGGSDSLPFVNRELSSK